MIFWTKIFVKTPKMIFLQTPKNRRVIYFDDGGGETYCLFAGSSLCTSGVEQLEDDRYTIFKIDHFHQSPRVKMFFLPQTTIQHIEL